MNQSVSNKQLLLKCSIWNGFSKMLPALDDVNTPQLGMNLVFCVQRH